MGGFEDAYWGLVQTLLWIRDRDPTMTGLNTLGRLIIEIDPERLRGAQSPIWFKARESRAELMTRLRTEATLHKALLAGGIVASGLKNATDERREIDPVLWHDLEFQYRSSWGPYAGPKSHRAKVSAWTHILFPRERVLNIWPQRGNFRRKIDHKKEAAGDRAKPEQGKAGRFSIAELERWYVSYVEKMKASGRIPSRNDDWRAARQELGDGVPRNSVRNARRKYAPKAWKHGGRRPSRRETGQN